MVGKILRWLQLVKKLQSLVQKDLTGFLSINVLYGSYKRCKEWLLQSTEVIAGLMTSWHSLVV